MWQINLVSDYLIKLATSRVGHTIGRVIIGVVGVLILAGFLAAVFTPMAVGALFPLIVGFNTALTGYGVIDKTRDGFHRKRRVAMAAGAGVVIVATAATNLLFWRVAGVAPIAAKALWILLPVGLATSWLGSALAIKYFGLGTGPRPPR